MHLLGELHLVVLSRSLTPLYSLGARFSLLAANDKIFNCTANASNDQSQANQVLASQNLNHCNFPRRVVEENMSFVVACPCDFPYLLQSSCHAGDPAFLVVFFNGGH